jgi:molybdopterin-binding protein
MKISARNILKGRIKAVKPGTVNTEIVIELPGGAEIVSIITKDSADSLGCGLRIADGKPSAQGGQSELVDLQKNCQADGTGLGVKQRSGKLA